MKTKTKSNNKKLTGADLGRLYVDDVAQDYQNFSEGKPQHRKYPIEKMGKLITENIAGNQEEIDILNGYIYISNWITKLYNTTAGFERALQNACRGLQIYLMASITDYELKHQREINPTIITKEEYDNLEQEARKEFFHEKDGTERTLSVLHLATIWAVRYLRDNETLLKYQTEPIKSKYLTDMYKIIFSKKAYALDDGTVIKEGSSGDIVTDIQRKRELSGDIPLSKSGKESAKSLIQLIIKKGYTHKEALEKVIEKELKAGTIVKGKLVLEQEEPPKDFTKWDIIKSLKLDSFYLSTKAKEYAAKQGKTLGEYFLEDFRELYEAAATDLKEKYGIDISSVPPKDFDKPFITNQKLYDLNVFEIQENLKTGNILIKESISHKYGLAVLMGYQRKRFWKQNKQGPQRPKEELHTFSGYTLKALRIGNNKDDIKAIQRAIKDMGISIKALKGVNAAIDIVAKEYGINKIKFFKASDTLQKNRINFVWGYIARLYLLISSYIPFTEQEQADKEDDLKALEELFKIPTYEEIRVSANKRREIKEKAKDFRSFVAMEPQFNNLVMYRV